MVRDPEETGDTEFSRMLTSRFLHSFQTFSKILGSAEVRLAFIVWTSEEKDSLAFCSSTSSLSTSIRLNDHFFASTYACANPISPAPPVITTQLFCPYTEDRLTLL